MTDPHISGASEQLAVEVRTAANAMHEHVSVQTRFAVQRWDEDQTAWALRKLGYGDTRPPMPGDRALQPGQFGSLKIAPYSSTFEDDCNLVVSTGWAALLGGVAGTSITTKFSAAAGRIGVGTSTTAAASTQTYLQGDTGSSSTTSYYQLVSGAPTINTGVIPATLVFVAAFGTGVANFAWQEFGTDNYTASGVYLNGLGGSSIFFNRGVSSQGTKASGQTWTATETISFGYPSGSGTLGTT